MACEICLWSTEGLIDFIIGGADNLEMKLWDSEVVHGTFQSDEQVAFQATNDIDEMMKKISDAYRRWPKRSEKVSNLNMLTGKEY